MVQRGINMINAIKYLKLDLQIIKEKNQYVYFALIPIFAGIMLKYIEFGLAGIVFLTFMCAGTPFTNEKLDKLDEMYRLFPYKSSIMIFGRFIYLFIMMIISLFICIFCGIYYSNNENGIMLMAETIIIENFFVVINFICYPLYYDDKIEKNNKRKTIVTSIITIIIFALIFCTSVEMKIMSSIFGSELNFIGNFILINSKTFIALEMLSFAIIGYISYLTSCKLYKRKEV